MSKAQVIALVNQKGGTGKTQSTENLGIGLANEGKKVLLNDKKNTWSFSADDVVDGYMIFAHKDSYTSYNIFDDTKSFTFDSLTTLAAAEGINYLNITTNFKNNLITSFRASLSDNNFSEQAVVSYVAAMSEAGKYQQAVDDIPQSYKRSEQRTYLSAPYFNNLVNMNNILGGSTMVNETGTSSNIENYKIAIIGNQHVGKTTILSRYKYETTDDTYAPTVGIDFLTKNVFLEDKTIRLVMWDTAGQERFKSLIPSYLKNANCVILTYDITDKSSFTSLNKWLSDARDNVVEGTFIILCGNKIDLNNKRAVPKEEGEKFAQENKIAYAETSATTGEGINELFNTIIGNFCDVPIINKEEKDDDDDLDGRGSKSLALKDLTKEEVKIEEQKKKNNCCGGGGNKKEKKKAKGK